jgi:RsiW-degrading membrane proteinase PrsW (M82 family)
VSVTQPGGSRSAADEQTNLVWQEPRQENRGKPGLLARLRRDPQRRKADRSGLPRPARPDEPLPKRIFANPLFWVGLVVLLTYAAALVVLYVQTVPEHKVPGGHVVGVGSEALSKAAKFAAITAIPLTALYLWADRFKPQRFWIWLFAFGWGACVAPAVASQVNSWAAAHLSVAGSGDPATASRAAIFVAPFVEEACKATVLFWLVILLRYRWVSRLSGIALAGLSATGFAFTENILYYGRAYRYAAHTFGAISPDAALHKLFVMRGVLTFFGHPLFTSITGIALAMAVRSTSKLVRVLGPAAGFCFAAFCHMTYNLVSSSTHGSMLLVMYFGVAVPVFIAMIVFIVRQEFRESRLIRERLTDYAQLGWLPQADVGPMSRLRTRLRALWQSIFLGGSTFLATLRMQRTETELAYLRDAMTRGIVDDAGLNREKLLLARARDQRSRAVVQPAARADYRRALAIFKRGRTQQAYQPPSYPGPAGLGGSMPAPGQTPIGPTAMQYSRVDPNWKPPQE